VSVIEIFGREVHGYMVETYADIEKVSEDIREGEVSPLEIVDECLARIKALDPKLNAFITVMAEEASKEALSAGAEVESGNWRGPLHGIPVGIKDFYDTAGVKTTAAFEHFGERVPVKDAAVVSRLKEAGAVVIGKTNMHTMGMGTTGLDSHFGAAINPWNAGYIPGGSSSGSAVAVASGMCYATVDTDAIGSCRLPAACCGVVGFKGTYGLIDASGILDGEGGADEMILWFNHAGITTRSILDTALLLDVLAERTGPGTQSYFDGLASDGSLRVGVGENISADPEVMAAFEEAVEVIRDLDYTVGEATIPFGDPGAGLDAIEEDRGTIADLVFGDFDVLILPTAPTTVPKVQEADGNPQTLSPEQTAFANYYGLPAVSVPCGFDASGLPIGLQMVARPWGEVSVLDLASQYQRATPWHKEHPDLQNEFRVREPKR
jgi:aspartyl-tRNA(Asn)/glutamyl-tRNA(Gln) amidotransferase subunit A